MRTLKDQGCGLRALLVFAVESLRFPLQRRGGRIPTARWYFTLLLLTLACLSSSVRAQQYLVTEIPAPADYPMAPPLGYAINAIGEVTGEFDPIYMSIQPYAPIDPRLFVYAYGNGSSAGIDANGYAVGTTTDLGPSNVPCSSHSSVTGYGINLSGQVVGDLCSTTENPLAFIYQNGQFIGFGEANEYAAVAKAVNASGLVTGTIEFPIASGSSCSGSYHAFIYNSGTATFNDLGPLSSGGCESYGFAINDAGQIAGYFIDAIGNSHAFVYSNGAVADIGYIQFPNPPVYCPYSAEANGINASGQVTGYSDGNCGWPEAFLYSNGMMVDIGNLGGTGGSVGNAINASGQVVGQAWTNGNAAQHAFIYSNGTLVDLNGLIPAGFASQYTLVNGVAINDAGQIVVQGYVDSNPSQTVTFLLTPTTTVPNVIGLTQAAATTAITGARLTLGTVATQASTTVLSGEVVSQSPGAGLLESDGTAVNLVISTGLPTTTVPNVVGLTQAAATAAITGASLTLGTVTTQASATVPLGEVVSQSPSAGLLESDGTAVNLVTSSGPATTTVPNVVNLTQAAATTAIGGASLTLGTVTRQASATIPLGEVVSQSPAAGLIETDGTAVNLVISTGPPTTTVPNVVDLTQAAATAAITGASLTLGTVTRQASTTVLSGEVVSQSPAAGVSASDGAAVNIIISTGLPTTTVPNVVGFMQAAATVVIEEASLTLGTVTTQASATAPLGTIVSQSPAAGLPESDGTAVNLIISAGPPTVSIVLSGAPTITGGAQGWIVTVNLANSGNVTVQTLQETSATLNGVAATGVSVPTGHVLPITGLAPGSSATMFLTFPPTAGAPGAAVRFALSGSYSATGLNGNWSVSLRSVTLP